MTPDPKSKSDPRSFRGSRLVIGGVIAVALVAAIPIVFAGDPNPQQGENLPNAPPQGSDAAG
jgi:hypothetical protein